MGLIRPGQPGAQYDPLAPVTRSELDGVLSKVRADFLKSQSRMHVLSTRFEALTKFLAFSLRSVDLGAFYTYSTKYGQACVPKIAAITNELAIRPRLDAAAAWNAANPDMPILCDDLALDDLALDPRYHLVSPEERAAVDAHPATTFFREDWLRILEANVEHWLGKVNGHKDPAEGT